MRNYGNSRGAFNYSKKIEKKKLDSFESHLILGIFYLKNSDIVQARKYFLKAKSKNSKFILNNYVSSSLYTWSNLLNINQASLEIEKLDERFGNLKIIQNVFLNCYFDSKNTTNLFSKMVSFLNEISLTYLLPNGTQIKDGTNKNNGDLSISTTSC